MKKNSGYVLGRAAWKAICAVEGLIVPDNPGDSFKKSDEEWGMWVDWLAKKNKRLRIPKKGSPYVDNAPKRLSSSSSSPEDKGNHGS